jgi:hypothetical protein
MKIKASLRAVAATVGVLGSVFAVASPASAVTYRKYFGVDSRTCIEAPQQGTTIGYISQCAIGDTHQQFTATRVGTFNGHDLVTIKNRWAGTCIDVNGTNAYPALKSCSGGADQKWEVFNQSGYQVLKSYGAWTNRDAHTCLRNVSSGSYLTKATCNANSDTQQWDD